MFESLNVMNSSWRASSVPIITPCTPSSPANGIFFNIFKQSNNIIIEVYICSKLVCVNACLQDTQSYLVLSDLVLCDRENLQTSHSKRDTSTLVRLRFLYIQCTRSWSVCINWKSGWAYNYWWKFGGMQRTFVFLFLKGITPHSKASQHKTI